MRALNAARRALPRQETAKEEASIARLTEENARLTEENAGQYISSSSHNLIFSHASDRLLVFSGGLSETARDSLIKKKAMFVKGNEALRQNL